MFEQDLLDEEVKKKKRRVLVGLFVLLLGGTLVAFPLAEQLFPAPSAVSEVAAGTPTASPAPTATVAAGGAGGGELTTPTAISEAASPTSTATVAAGGAGGGELTTPTAISEAASPTFTATVAAGGAGGGTLATPAASLTPTVAPQPSATLALPGELPAAGGSSFWGFSLLTLGMAAILLGLQMLRMTRSA